MYIHYTRYTLTSVHCASQQLLLRSLRRTMYGDTRYLLTFTGVCVHVMKLLLRRKMNNALPPAACSSPSLKAREDEVTHPTPGIFAESS